MQHGGRWTALASPYRLLLLRDYAQYADMGRELIRTVPDCRELEFKLFRVSMRAGQIAGMTVKVESEKRCVWFDMSNNEDGLVASAVVDRRK